MKARFATGWRVAKAVAWVPVIAIAGAVAGRQGEALAVRAANRSLRGTR